jgi:hypothetical protein
VLFGDPFNELKHVCSECRMGIYPHAIQVDLVRVLYCMLGLVVLNPEYFAADNEYFLPSETSFLLLKVETCLEPPRRLASLVMG